MTWKARTPIAKEVEAFITSGIKNDFSYDDIIECSPNLTNNPPTRRLMSNYLYKAKKSGLIRTIEPGHFEIIKPGLIPAKQPTETYQKQTELNPTEVGRCIILRCNALEDKNQALQDRVNLLSDQIKGLKDGFNPLNEEVITSTCAFLAHSNAKSRVATPPPPPKGGYS